jgi:tetratricopeptide (TPR) repeat protein/energy-coupling factor transporter ATP-binding protein EcfA2
MERTAPIGREAELARLRGAAEDAESGHGAIVFLAGPTGSGKSFLLNAFTNSLKPDEVVSVLCYETGAGNPLGPFGEILRALTSKERRGDQAKRVLDVVGRVAPPLIELIPVIGKLAALGVKAGSDLGVYALGGNHESQQAQLASDVALALREISADTPLVVVIDDAHWIDAPSTEVLARLSQSATEQPLLLVVAYDPGLLDDRHPLARTRASVVGRPGVHDVELGELTPAGIESLLLEHYGSVPAPLLAEWLHDRSDGSPLFVEQFLARLEEQGVLRQGVNGWTLDGAIAGEPGAWSLGGALAQAQTPDTLLELLKPRVADLGDEERALLETGAVQGRRFLSTVLVRLLDREEDEILDRLAQVAERRRMITAEETEDWWSDRSALYTFDPGLLQELLYGRYARSPYERRRRHRAVAEALEALVAEDDPPPRHALLEIARHYAEAHVPLKAGATLVEVAESTLAEGAERETVANAERALQLLREAARGKLEPEAETEAQRLIARAILLVLLGRESSWHADSAPAAERMLALAEEAEQAASAAGDAKLKANARYATAYVLTVYRGLEEAIGAYQEALELARAAGDPVAELAILIDFGHQYDSVDLRKGWEILQQAHTLLTGDALAGVLGGDRLAQVTARLDSTIGVAAFDLGRFGEALDSLTQSCRALRELRQRDEGAWALAFLGQLYTAIGLFEEAEASLREGIALFDGEAGALGVRGYLRSLLGRVALEADPPRLPEAREVLAGGREETVRSGYGGVIALVQSHWTELLLAEGTPGALAEAEEVLESTGSFGWARSEIALASLRARVALARGRVEQAVELSTRATARLEDLGGAVPAVRSEEILFAHGRVLAAAGSAEADAYVRKAAEVVRAKADSLTAPAQKESFLQVRLSREILGA